MQLHYYSHLICHKCDSLDCGRRLHQSVCDAGRVDQLGARLAIDAWCTMWL